MSERQSLFVLRRVFLLVCVLGIFCCAVGAADSPTEECALIKTRLVAKLLPKPLTADQEAEAKRLILSLQPDGSWADVDYTDQSRAYWKKATHLERALLLARYLRQETTPPEERAKARDTVARALDLWLQRDYPDNPNWWHNQVWFPGKMGDILLLMESELPPELVRRGIERMELHDIGPTTRPLAYTKNWLWSGQNLIWAMANQVRVGCLKGDSRLVRDAFAQMAGEIKIVTGWGDNGDGIRGDFSFHQHRDCFYSGEYGFQFALNAAEWAEVVNGTSMAFPPEKLKIIDGFLLDGQQWFEYRGNFEYGSRGRGITRVEPLPFRNGRDLLVAVQRRLQAPSSRQDELRQMAERLEGLAPPLSGNRHFWKSDIMVHRRADFYASVRLFSNRIDNTDWAANGEGLVSHHLADGVTFLMRRGDEYHDIFPLWNWRRLPGITAEQSDEPLPLRWVRTRGTRAFVGGVSDGQNGLAAMDFERGELTARKSWFFIDNEIICLGTGITCTSDRPVLTSLNQCLLNGPVSIGDRTGVHTLTDQTQDLQTPVAVAHDGIGYQVWGPGQAMVSTRSVEGDWNQITKAGSGAVRKDVFSLALAHGTRPFNQNYQYRIGLGVTADLLREWQETPPAQVLVNTPQMQAVYCPEKKMVMLAAYQAGEVAVDGIRIEIAYPCLVLLREIAPTQLRIAVSNPANRGIRVGIWIFRDEKNPGPLTRWSDVWYHSWPDHFRADRPVFRLPDGEQAGATLVQTFTLPER